MSIHISGGWVFPVPEGNSKSVTEVDDDGQINQVMTFPVPEGNSKSVTALTGALINSGIS